VWYRRAVEQYFVEEQSFVYSVPFSSTNFNDTLVTASHAIFHTEGSKSAPAAVVGFQFQHSALHTLFKNITSTVCWHPIIFLLTFNVINFSSAPIAKGLAPEMMLIVSYSTTMDSLWSDRK
jgi:hypothetical protein